MRTQLIPDSVISNNLHLSYDVHVNAKRVGFLHFDEVWILHLDDLREDLEDNLEDGLDNLKDFVYNRYPGQKVSIREV